MLIIQVFVITTSSSLHESITPAPLDKLQGLRNSVRQTSMAIGGGGCQYSGIFERFNCFCIPDNAQQNDSAEATLY